MMMHKKFLTVLCGAIFMSSVASASLIIDAPQGLLIGYSVIPTFELTSSLRKHKGKMSSLNTALGSEGAQKAIQKYWKDYNLGPIAAALTTTGIDMAGVSAKDIQKSVDSGELMEKIQSTLATDTATGTDQNQKRLLQDQNQITQSTESMARALLGQTAVAYHIGNVEPALKIVSGAKTERTTVDVLTFIAIETARITNLNAAMVSGGAMVGAAGGFSAATDTYDNLNK